MTVGKILELFDSYKSNELCDSVKIGWMSDVEGRILCEIHKMPQDAIVLPNGSEDDLALPESYARVYLLYMAAMTEFVNGNYDAYIKINGEFESALAMYARYYIRNRK